MKILLDTNIVLDKLNKRQPFNLDADKIFDLIIDGEIIGYITASNITDIYYLLCKAIGTNASMATIENLLDIFEVISVTKSDCRKALKSGVKDFEDALVAVCALKADLDYIITRDVEFLTFEKSISPDDFVSKVLGV